MKNFLFLWVKLNECVVLDLIVPSEVQKLKAEKRGENFIDIGWYLPKRINGDLQQFVVTYQEGESGVFFCKFGIGQVPIQFRQLSLNLIQLENLYDYTRLLIVRCPIPSSFIHSFMHSFIHSFTHSYIHSSSLFICMYNFYFVHVPAIDTLDNITPISSIFSFCTVDQHVDPIITGEFYLSYTACSLWREAFTGNRRRHRC